LPPGGDDASSWGQEGVVVAWGVAILALSELARVRREQWARERAERAQAARRRADEERLRIARELHDVLAHSISVINVQAGVGLALLDSDPDQARTALTTIKAASKEALGEIRQVLGTLRSPGEAPRDPAPGLDRLPELVAQAADAGLTVDIEGEPPPLPPGTDLAAFRIVQEALTNVVRHSGARHARVRLAHGGGELRLRIDDDGPATGADAGGGGNGLVGMRERAAALGGTIEAGPRADGGFGVLAVLPVRAPRESEADR
jgi:signal transduction histidine kinase